MIRVRLAPFTRAACTNSCGLQREDAGADDPRQCRCGEDHQGHDQVEEPGAHDGDDQNREQDAGEGEHDVDQPHGDGVGPAAEVARDEADQRTNEHPAGRADEADEERDAGAVENAASTRLVRARPYRASARMTAAPDGSSATARAARGWRAAARAIQRHTINSKKTVPANANRFWTNSRRTRWPRPDRSSLRLGHLRQIGWWHRCLVALLSRDVLGRQTDSILLGADDNAGHSKRIRGSM